MTPAAPFTPAILTMLGGLIVWAARFFAVYGFTAIACAKGWAARDVAGIGVVPFGIAIASAVALAACAALLARAGWRWRIQAGAPFDGSEGFVHAIAAAGAGLAMLAILWETLPALLLPTCRS